MKSSWVKISHRQSAGGFLLRKALPGHRIHLNPLRFFSNNHSYVTQKLSKMYKLQILSKSDEIGMEVLKFCDTMKMHIRRNLCLTIYLPIYNIGGRINYV